MQNINFFYMVVLLMSAVSDCGTGSHILSLATSHNSQCHFIIANIHVLRTALPGTLKAWQCKC